MNINELDLSKCVGCEVCRYICPKSCIDFVGCDLGHKYPKVNMEECIQCGKCLATCQIVKSSELTFNKPGKALSFHSDNKEILFSSSSGGLFQELAYSFINNGGVVYGATFSDKKCFHTRADSIDKIKTIIGSKYVYSSLNDIFNLLLEDINQGREILFVGLPCQIASLKLLLRKNDLTNLYFIDLICHGAPSAFFLEKYLSYLEEKEQDVVVDVKFRQKKNLTLYKKTHFCLEVLFENKTIYYPYFSSFYYFAFLKKESYRLKCYSCNFAKTERLGDVTLGDCWGYIQKNSLGLSLALVNNKKGERLLSFVKEKNIESVSFDSVTKNNEQLMKPSAIPSTRQELIKLFCDTSNFSKFEKKYFKLRKFEVLKSKIKFYIPRNIKRIIFKKG